MLHQAAQLDEIELAGPPGAAGTAGTGSTGPEPSPGASSPYGGGDTCSGVVRAAISSIEDDGTVHTSAALGSGTLPVDFDVSSNDTVAVAFAGTGGSSGEMGKFFEPPQTFALFLPNTLSSGPRFGGAGGAAPTDETSATSAFPDCVGSDSKATVPLPVVALRFNPANPDELFLFSRNPATLYSVSVGQQSTFTLDLGGRRHRRHRPSCSTPTRAAVLPAPRATPRAAKTATCGPSPGRSASHPSAHGKA